MVLKVYGSANSTCTKRVAAVLNEKKILFELIKVDLANSEHKSAEYLKKQPFGQIPYIDDDGFVVYESRAICRYVCAKYHNQGTNLVPTGLQATALFEQAISSEGTNFDPPTFGAIFENYKPNLGLATDKAALDKFLETLDAKLNAYDVILSKQKYIAGDEITLADMFHLPHGSMLITTGSDIMGSKPNVARWWKDITSRESWVAVKDGVKSTA